MANRLYNYRMKPRQVTITNTVTGELETFPSMYKAAKAYNVDPKTIWRASNKEVWREKYIVKIK